MKTRVVLSMQASDVQVLHNKARELDMSVSAVVRTSLRHSGILPQRNDQSGAAQVQHRCSTGTAQQRLEYEPSLHEYGHYDVDGVWHRSANQLPE